MLKQLHLTFLRGTLIGALAVGGVACGDSDDPGTTPPDNMGTPSPDVSTLPATQPNPSGGATGFDDVLGQQLAALDNSQCVWASSTGTYTVNLSLTKNVAILSVSGTTVVVNDVPCNADGTNTAPAIASLKILNINGTTGNGDVVVLDYSGGFFGLGGTGTAAGNGTNIDLKAGTSDRVLVRGGSGVDRMICGSTGTLSTATSLCNVNYDGLAVTTGNEMNTSDIKKFLGVELVQFGMGEGNDVFTAQGSAAWPLATIAGTWGTSPFVIPLLVNGGANDDNLAGGGGADTMLGWTGDDIINAEASKAGGHDIFSGGEMGETAGDTISYAARTGGVLIQNDDMWTAATGEDFSGDALPGVTSPEQDRINSDFEIYVGGSGNDTFGMGGDAVNGQDAAYDGGAGSDTADYSARTLQLDITLAGDTPATGNGDNSIATDENDSLQRVENAIGGTGVDAITGSDADNVIEGRDGIDSIVGGLGNDTIIEGGTVTTSVALSDADEIDGGDGFDTVSYAGRAAGVTVALDIVGEATGDDGGTGETDDIYNVERVIGTDHVDTMTASGLTPPAGCVLEGGLEADVLTGGTGNDRLEGGAGTDNYAGGCGAGDDTIIDDQDITVGNLATYACENKI